METTCDPGSRRLSLRSHRELQQKQRRRQFDYRFTPFDHSREAALVHYLRVELANTHCIEPRLATTELEPLTYDRFHMGACEGNFAGSFLLSAEPPPPRRKAEGQPLRAGVICRKVGRRNRNILLTGPSLPAI